MQTIVRVNANLQWQVNQDAESARWVASCDALRLAVEGETYAVLMETIADTLNMLFRDLLKGGELDVFLKHHSWTLINHLSEPLVDKNIWFDIPVQLLGKGQTYGAARAAH